METIGVRERKREREHHIYMYVSSERKSERMKEVLIKSIYNVLSVNIYVCLAAITAFQRFLEHPMLQVLLCWALCRIPSLLFRNHQKLLHEF